MMRRLNVLKLGLMLVLVVSIGFSTSVMAFADTKGTVHGGGGIKFGDETSSSTPSETSSSGTKSSGTGSSSSEDDNRSTTHVNPSKNTDKSTVHESASGNKHGGSAIPIEGNNAGGIDPTQGASTGGTAGAGSSSTNEDSENTNTSGGGATGGNIAGVEGEFPETHAPQIYDPTQETNSNATLPSMGGGAIKGNEVENIEEFEEEVERGTRSSMFDSILLVAGGIMFFYAAVLLLAYGLDRVSVFPNFSLLKFLTFGKYDIYGITVGQFLMRDSALIVAGILLGSGVAKKLITLILIAFFELFK